MASEEKGDAVKELIEMLFHPRDDVSLAHRKP